MYAVQSALYFWNKGNKYNSKYAVELAEDDDIEAVSKAINRYDSKGLPSRKKYYNNARKKDAFDLVRHHKDIYDNGNDEQKKESKSYFEKWKTNDLEAKKIIDKINKDDTEKKKENDKKK
jgi:predicted RNA polymerase sigma factor